MRQDLPGYVCIPTFTTRRKLQRRVEATRELGLAPKVYTAQLVAPCGLALTFFSNKGTHFFL